MEKTRPNIRTENFDIQKHIEQGVESIVSDALKATLKSPKESAFMLRFASASRKASRIRMEAEERGAHTPAFLIASITSSCNLHCAGCYARGIETTTDAAPACQLSGAEWENIFREAESLGISFILVVGGEPLLRRDVITAASKIQNIIFPVFTNSTCMDDAYMKLFNDCRNLVPVLSIEGRKETTDRRRGEGIYDIIAANMKKFKENHMLFGASITVTTGNIQEVTSPAFVGELLEQGCRMVLFVEYVPTQEDDKHLAPSDPERKYLTEIMDTLRSLYSDVILLSFPGDELAMGGCMAAGREFFHINSHGGAEPCPFSPFSDINVRDSSLRDALNSNLFRRIRLEGLLQEDHAGGCVLYEKQEEVKALLKS